MTETNNKRKKVEIKTNSYSFSSYKNLNENNKFKNYVLLNLVDDKEMNDLNKDLSKKTIDELNELLKYKLSSLFKDFATQSRESKSNIENRHGELIRVLEKDYVNSKAKLEEKYIEEVKDVKKQLQEIDESIKFQKVEVKNIKKEVENKLENSNNKLLELDNKSQKTQHHSQAVSRSSEKFLNADEISAKINLIDGKINYLNKKRHPLIETLNEIELKFTNEIDVAFIKKEKEKSGINIDKIEAYIWIRNNLIALNRVIRDAKIQLGLKNSNYRWEKINETLGEIQQTINSIRNEFKLFDEISDVAIKVDLSNAINTSARIIKLKTSENIK